MSPTLAVVLFGDRLKQDVLTTTCLLQSVFRFRLKVAQMSLKTCVRVVTLGAGMYEQRKLVEGRREGKCKDLNRKIKKKKEKRSPIKKKEKRERKKTPKPQTNINKKRKKMGELFQKIKNKKNSKIRTNLNP